MKHKIVRQAHYQKKSRPGQTHHLHKHIQQEAHDFWSFFKTFLLGAFTVLAAIALAIGGIHLVLAQEGGMMGGNPTTRGETTREDMMGPGSAAGDERGGRMDRNRSNNEQGDKMPMDDRLGSERMGRPLTSGADERKDNGMMREPLQNQTEERTDTQQKQMEERKNQMEVRQQVHIKEQFSQMKNRFKSLSVMFKMLTSRIASLEKQGIGVPSDLKSELSDAQSALQTILSADSMDADGVEDAISSLQENGQNLRQAMPMLEQLAQIPAQLKRAASEVRKLELQATRLQKSATRSKIDVSEQTSQLTQIITEMKSALDQAKQSLASGNAEEVMSTLQDNIYDKMEDAYQLQGVIQTLQNIKSQLTQFDRFISQAKRNLTKLAKSGEDVREAKGQLDDMIGKLADLKRISAQKITDVDELKNIIDDLIQAEQDLSDSLNVSSSFNAPNLPSSGSGTTSNDLKQFEEFNFQIK